MRRRGEIRRWLWELARRLGRGQSEGVHRVRVGPRVYFTSGSEDVRADGCCIPWREGAR